MHDRTLFIQFALTAAIIMAARLLNIINGNFELKIGTSESSLYTLSHHYFELHDYLEDNAIPEQTNSAANSASNKMNAAANANAISVEVYNTCFLLIFNLLNLRIQASAYENAYENAKERANTAAEAVSGAVRFEALLLANKFDLYLKNRMHVDNKGNCRRLPCTKGPRTD